MSARLRRATSTAASGRVRSTALLLGLVAVTSPARGDEPASFRDHAPAPRPETSFPVPRVDEARLANGVRVLLVERHGFPVVSVRIVSDVGALHARTAVASLAADVARRGGVGSTLLEGRAEPPASAAISAYAGFDRTEIEVKVLSNEVNGALAYAAGLVTHPSWSQESLDREIEARVEAIHGGIEDTEDLAYAATYPAGHPLHNGVEGRLGDLQGAKLDPLRAHWSRAYSRGHVTVIVVGDVERAPTLAALEAAFGDIPQANVPPVTLPPLAPRRRAQIVIHASGGSQSKLIIGCPAPARGSPDYYPMRVLDAVLGGGMTSRLFRIRSEHGASYGVFSDLWPRRDGGLLVVHGAVERAATGESIGRVLTELGRLATTPVSDEELARAKSRLTHQLTGNWATVEGLSGTLASFALLGLPMDELGRYEAHIRAVTAAQVEAVAKRYADPANVSITVVGDPSLIEAQISASNLGAWRVEK